MNIYLGKILLFSTGFQQKYEPPLWTFWEKLKKENKNFLNYVANNVSKSNEEERLWL